MSGIIADKINLNDNYKSTYSISTTNLPQGMYLVAFKGKEELLVTKLMVMH